jgi:Holliday junction DNA helicase RuvB
MVTVVGDGLSHRVRLEPFTLIGATTNMGKLLKPLKDRFGIKVALRPYSAEKLAEIVQAAAAKMGTQCSPEAALEIARRSQSTPRVALSILRRVADCAFVAEAQFIDHAIAVRGCEVAGYDKSGLSELGRLYLQKLAERGVPVALGTMVSMLGETKDVVEDEVEPYLLGIGFIEKTSRGRAVTAEGRRHLMGAV